MAHYLLSFKQTLISIIMTEKKTNNEETFEPKSKASFAEEEQNNNTDFEKTETAETVNEDSATDDPSSELTLEQELAQARAELEELKTQALYKQAEFENYRKRTIKEKADLILNGSKSAVIAMLPIVDDLERALPSMQKAEDVAAVAEGVELIYQKFLKTLAGLGVKQIETEGKEFNVDLHEAIAQVPGVPDEQKGRVIDCVEKGYMLNDNVIRHAKVAVGM